MNWSRIVRSRYPSYTLTAGLVLLLISPCLPAQWTQWGGPTRDFNAPAGKIGLTWPLEGPALLWSKELGEGFSSVLFDQGVLFTMHRDAEEEVVSAIDAQSGETLWRTGYTSPQPEDLLLDFGGGPISTPLIVGDRIFTVGNTVKLHCLDKKSGTILWKRDLRDELGASHMGRGYGPSPVAYQNLLILTVGAKGNAVVAFRQDNGETVWSSLDHGPSYSSPMIGQVNGRPELIVASGHYRAGLEPLTGAVEWSLELPEEARRTMAMQHWDPQDHVLFSSQAYGGGSRAIRLKEGAGGFETQELWYTRKMRIMFTSFLRIGNYVYGSSGDFGPAILMCLDLRDGSIQWRQRGFGRTHFVRAGQHVVLLEEGGDLAVATVSPESIEVHSRAHILERICFTPPTLVGTRLFVRNRKRLAAFELSASRPDPAAAHGEVQTDAP